MAAGSAGEGAGSNTELRWTFSRLACQSELELACGLCHRALTLHTPYCCSLTSVQVAYPKQTYPLLTVARAALRRVRLSLFEVKSRIRAVSALSRSIFCYFLPLGHPSGTAPGCTPAKHHQADVRPRHRLPRLS